MLVKQTLDMLGPDSGPPHGLLVHLTGQKVRSVHRTFNRIASSSVNPHHMNIHYASEL